MIGWERHCAEFAAAHVRKATGRDIWTEIGGIPRSPREAADLYRRLGARSLGECMTVLFGQPRNPLLAARGDIVLVKSGQVSALGICRGDLVECADSVLPLTRGLCAWSIGHG